MTATPRYVPQAGSVAGRVCEYFRKHPAAELSSAEVAERFGCKASDLSALLASAVQAKALTSETREFAGARGRYFSAGPAIMATAPDAPAPAPPPQAAAPRTDDDAQQGYGVPTGVVPRNSQAGSEAKAHRDGGWAPPYKDVPPAPEPAKAGYVTAVVPRRQPWTDNTRRPLTADQIRIHDNLPKPNPARGTQPVYRPILERLSVGQAIEYPRDYQGSITAAARKLANDTGRVFSTRVISETHSATWRDA